MTQKLPRSEQFTLKLHYRVLGDFNRIAGEGSTDKDYNYKPPLDVGRGYQAARRARFGFD
jgi:hypothetical protein